jgi:hypothetical protein
MAMFPLEEYMTDQLRQEPLTQSSPANVDPAQGLTGAAGWRQQMWHKKQEKEWEGNLRSLQQCICELLIKNQQLRESLASATNQRNQGRTL